MIYKKLPSQKYLKECFDYSPYLGTIYWRERPRKHFTDAGQHARINNMHSGRKAGTISGNGHLSISIGGVIYKAHRLIWKIMTGKEPTEQIDHRDNNKINNTWRNLREATHVQNLANQGVRNELGVKGVRKVVRKKGLRYEAQISDGGVKQYLGIYNTSEEAHAAYKEAARNLHKEFANPG